MAWLCWNVSATLRNAGQSGSLSLRLLLMPTYISLGLVPLWVNWKKGYCNWQWRKFQYNFVTRMLYQRVGHATKTIDYSCQEQCTGSSKHSTRGV